ncbi:hypothetical protein tinsulaeT_00240 [Thalassotalea insulae]|uniref:Uncharacterized protein n=1 Tax=Thalassotalea insulae TaxID=2056778 RepID=A0ABQ6GMX9_9GAMM|nr:hypothetical protein tinsulaeT_00240 [Thalassotalea insulae]
MFKAIFIISLFAGAIYFLLSGDYSYGVPILVVAMAYSKYETGYFFFGFETLSDESEHDSGCGGDSGGDGGCGGD